MLSLRRSHRLGLLLAVAGVVTLLLLFGGLPGGVVVSSSAFASLGRRPSPAAGFTQQAQLTTVLAHAPGFTVFENLYWQNDTFFVLTDKPWSVPDADYIAIRTGPQRAGWVTPNKAIKVLAVRGPPINAFVKEERQLGETVSPSDALDYAASAVDLPSPMLINHDDDFVSHYYHWIGETFLGAWRIWSNYKFSAGLPALPDFKAVAFRHTYSLENTPYHLDYSWEWEDHAGANRWFMEHLFPSAVIEDKLTWDTRTETDTLYRIKLAVLGDRWAGHRGPSAAWKPWGDVLRLPVDDNYLLDLRARVLVGDVKRSRRGSRPRITYLERQDTSRRLHSEAHRELVAALQELEDEKLVDLAVVKFTNTTSFAEQIRIIADTDFLVAVHGNGLTHALWMDPGKCKGVFEMQPRACSINDFSPLAMAAGVQHYLVNEEGMCTPDKCADRGCKGPTGTEDPWGPNRNDIDVDNKLITGQIRAILAEHCGVGS